jgi:transcriptional regulator with XRE-family HTH domain
MTDQACLDPIRESVLDEHWFSLRLKTWRAVTRAVKALGVDQKTVADRIGMDAGQFNKIISGKKSNVTLRTLHNIARAANHRLQISLVPLAGLTKPNYSYEARQHERRTEWHTSEVISGETIRKLSAQQLEPADVWSLWESPSAIGSASLVKIDSKLENVR